MMKRNVKHTPGPWSAEESPESEYFDVKVHMSRGYLGVATYNSRADANLIAAAPDMLAALRGVLAHMEARGLDTYGAGEFAFVRAAIAKAEGGE